MKKTILTLTVMLATAALITVFCGSAMAKVTGSCGGCHTMHNSQGGSHMMLNTTIDGTGGFGGGGYPALTRGTCVGCHTGDVTAGPIPFVNSLSKPDTYLAGGNFYWVAQEGGSAKGHNVKGVPGIIADAVLTAAPGDTLGTGCTNSCHYTLFTPDASSIGGASALDTGCQGCHVATEHHATQQADGAPALKDNGYFRFLSSHINDDNGVHGIEDNDWQYATTASNHNEYLGSTSSTNNTMTGYCIGCHGNFHNQLDSADNWIRHPSDAVLPNEGEYLAYKIYDPIAPVARPNLITISDNGLVANNSDMVMCLSCHRAHGSPYDDLLRWEYDGMIAGGGTGCATGTGCFVCHTEKDSKMVN